jgi:hypothetical protein
MDLEEVRQIADAVMYEGYILYPYRASAQKNRSRWQFGVLMPASYVATDPSETSQLRAEVVFEHDGEPSVEVAVRFLQVQRRTGWDEAVAQEINVRAEAVELLGEGHREDFAVPGGEEPTGHRAPLAGAVELRASTAPRPWPTARLTVTLTNRTDSGELPPTRDHALPHALIAAHLILKISGGRFLSMTDGPEWAAPIVAECQNTGCWPVLAGPADRTIMLAAPIILPDYPGLAPESAGELYDGTEIDEILTLRTLALSDEEKAAARATDPRAAALIDRVETMDGDTLTRLHGTIRDIKPDGNFVVVAGRRITEGSRVTLRPGIRRTDAQDMFLAGRTGLVQAVLHDEDGADYIAVTLADDPDADLRIAHGRFLYFAPDEVEPL